MSPARSPTPDHVMANMHKAGRPSAVPPVSGSALAAVPLRSVVRGRVQTQLQALSRAGLRAALKRYQLSSSC
jgi:hypothetical protein